MGEARVPPSVETQVQREHQKLHKNIKTAIEADHPGALNTALAELVRLTTEGETHVIRLAAIRELLNRYYGKPVERKTIKRTGTAGPSVNVAIMGENAWILDAVKDPASRIAVAAEIHRRQLEHQTIEVPTNGDEQDNGTEVCSGPGIPIPGIDGV